MTKTAKKTAPTKAQLRHRAKELEAQLPHSLYYASVCLPKAQNLMASGVMIELTALGGTPLAAPFVIKDGLSKETIEALQRDIKRTWDISNMHKPKGFEGAE